MTPGPLIKRLREEKGWSQRELGRRSGVHHSLISRLENGLQDDTQAHNLLRLAEALGVPLMELLAEELPEEQLMGSYA